MTLLGVIFLLMGNWFLLPYYVLVGILCINYLEGRLLQKPKRLTAAWTAASLLYNGVNLLPIWFFWDTYYDFALGKRHGAELHGFLCALLHLSRLAGLYSAVYDADGLF